MTSRMRNSLISGKNGDDSYSRQSYNSLVTTLLILLYFRPICLGLPSDHELNLAERTGVVAGWGATEVSYAHTTCGYTTGVVDPSSGSNVLKKVEGMR